MARCIATIVYPFNLERKVLDYEGYTKAEVRKIVEDRYPTWKIISIKEVVENDEE